MPTTPTAATGRSGRSPRPLTGRMVLFYLVTFFGIVFAVNFTMAHIAVSSFSGLETESAYKAGLAFENDVAAARAQDALHWAVEAKLQHLGDATQVTVTARDAAGRPLTGLTPEIILAHPTDRRRDVPLAFVETAPGQFRSTASIPPGQWDLMIEFRRTADTVFRSKSRIEL